MPLLKTSMPNFCNAVSPDECDLCARKSGIKNYQCLGCVVRDALSMPKHQRIGYMQEAAEKGGHDIETIKAEMKKRYVVGDK